VKMTGIEPRRGGGEGYCRGSLLTLRWLAKCGARFSGVSVRTVFYLPLLQLTHPNFLILPRAAHVCGDTGTAHI
jgi:hypothetical protein